MFGYHKWMHINHVSLLHYMYLALGQTIVDLDTPTLIGLMRRLMYTELPPGTFICNYTNMNGLLDLFSEDDMVFMRKHLDNLKVINEACNLAQDEVKRLEANIQGTVFSHEKDRFRQKCNSILNAIEPQSNQMAIATSYLALQFCPKCHKSYDPREQLGVFLPKIKSRLDVAKMNEENGYFLLPKQ
jgi:hypothetical protein